MSNIFTNDDGKLVYQGDTFQIVLNRYSDPDRKNLARNAAIYLGKEDRGNTRRPLSIIRKRHALAIFRGEMVEFEFVDVSKEVYDHIITYTTANMRAAGGNRALESDDFTMPSDKMKDAWNVRHSIEISMAEYKSLLKQGETPQVARAAMPVNAKMNNFVYQFNFLTLGESVFKQRIWEMGAQGNTVKVIKAMFELCSYMDKDLWDTFYKYMGTPAIEWNLAGDSLERVTIHELLNELHALAMNPESGQNGNESVKDYLRRNYGKQKPMW